MGVFVIAGGHAPPPLEPAEAPFHGIARLIPFRVVGPGVRAPLPGRNDGFDALLFPPRAEGIAVIARSAIRQGSSESVQASPRPGPGCCRGAGRPSRAGAGRGDPPACGHVDLGAEAAPAAAEGGIRPLVFGRARRAHVSAIPRAASTKRRQF